MAKQEWYKIPIDLMSVRQFYSHTGPGWDQRMGHPKYNWKTREVESDEPKFPKNAGDNNVASNSSD